MGSQGLPLAKAAGRAPGLRPRQAALLIAFTLLILLPGRIALPPLDRDESRYMEATSQMIATGNLVDVRFQDQPRYLQPAGIYWLEDAAVTAVEGLSGSAAPRREAWAYRLPSLAAAVANVLLTASIGTALFGVDAGFLAGLLLAASVLFNVEGRMATIDTVLLTAVLVAERALLVAWRDAKGSVAAGLAFWAAIGCGLMLKGPVILIPALGTLAALCAAERSLRMWRATRPLLGIPLALLIVLPWCVAILRISHGTFFSTAIGHNLLGKVAGGQQAHGLPPGTYLAMFLAAFWPGSVFAALAIPFVWAERRTRPVLFALAAIVPHWIVYELIATKLPHYVLPAFPAIAVLTAAGLLQRRGAMGVVGTAYAVLWLVAGLAFAAAGPVLLFALQGEIDALAIAFAGGGAVLIGFAAAALFRARRLRAASLAIAASLVTVTGLFLFVVPKLDTIWLSPRIAATMGQIRPCPASRLVSASFTEPSLVFLAGRDTLLTMPQAAAAVLGHDSCAVALVSRRDAAAFRAALTVPVRKLGEIDGVNYSTGRRLALSFFAADPRP